MARQRNPDGNRLRGFTLGVNNVVPLHDAPKDEFGDDMSVREAVNIDFRGAHKKPRRRAGYARVAAGRAHSPATLKNAGVMLAVVDGDLNAYDTNLDLIDTVRAGVGGLYLTYAQVNDDLYWSSPIELRRIRGGDLADTPGWIACPGTPAAEPYESGGLAAGAYRVAATWFDSEGRESGAAGIAIATVAEGQGVRVYDIPSAPEDATRLRLYISAPDGDELYSAGDYDPGVTQTLLGAGAGQDGRVLETLWRQPLPPCEILRFWNGRLLGASGNLLVWSDAMRFGLTTHDNYLKFGQRITMMEPVGAGEGAAGIFVADHKNTYWLGGDTPGKWAVSIRYDHPVVPGTSLVVKGTDVGLDTTMPVAFWLSANGVFCAGLPGGEVRPLTEGRLAMPGGERGASMFREYEGLRQLVTSFLSTTANGLAFSDRVTATVTPYSTPQ